MSVDPDSLMPDYLPVTTRIDREIDKMIREDQKQQKSTSTSCPLIKIPYIDIRRPGGERSDMTDLVQQELSRLQKLYKMTLTQFGWLSRIFMPLAYPVLDFFSRRWLKKTNNPYAQEIENAAELLGESGLVAQNVAYEWSCTSGAVKKPGKKAPILFRVMDWIVKGMGENIVVSHQSGPAGDFHNMTWPGLSGVFNGVAKGRFAAVINQAPIRRHLFGGVIIDWFRSRLDIFSSKALSPTHLLRKAFEEAANYSEAKEMLTREPVAAPVIYILSGTEEGEGCVIERIENEGFVREMGDDRVVAANHFRTSANGRGFGWIRRTENSADREMMGEQIPATDIEDVPTWFQSPIANQYSKLAMVANARTGEFSLFGTEAEDIVTQEFTPPI